MKTPFPSAALSCALTLGSIANLASAHSWVEYARRVAPNGTMVGPEGFPRGYIPRNDPGFGDNNVLQILPPNGQPFYSGDEILNRFPFQDQPAHPMLEAAPGDVVAFIHMENGHTTLPENQPAKPRNRGTIFFYGTSQPNEQEKLFDVHLLWSKDGKGGDGRGSLIATRNYDDGQCYQPNSSPIAQERVSAHADKGARPEQELACQSDVRLPDNLEPGSIYTIYWYWDWPDLNPDAIDIEATTNGVFPWAGSFMRDGKDPSGMPADAIARNESYALTVDIRIVDPKQQGFALLADDLSGNSFVDSQDVYSMGIKSQMTDNFAVPVTGTEGGDNQDDNQDDNEDGNEGGNKGGNKGGKKCGMDPNTPRNGTQSIVTVTVYETKPAETIVQTVTVTDSPTLSGSRPLVTPFMRRRRSKVFKV